MTPDQFFFPSQLKNITKDTLRYDRIHPAAHRGGQVKYHSSTLTILLPSIRTEPKDTHPIEIKDPSRYNTNILPPAHCCPRVNSPQSPVFPCIEFCGCEVIRSFGLRLGRRGWMSWWILGLWVLRCLTRVSLRNPRADKDIFKTWTTCRLKQGTWRVGVVGQGKGGTVTCTGEE